MKFTEKTIKRLEEIGITTETFSDVYENKDHTVYAEELGDGTFLVDIDVRTFIPTKTKESTIRERTEKAIALAEQAEKIIKENGK